MTRVSEKILRTESGNATIVTMDHGLVFGALKGFKNPESTLDKVLAGNPDSPPSKDTFSPHSENPPNGEEKRKPSQEPATTTSNESATSDDKKDDQHPG